MDTAVGQRSDATARTHRSDKNSSDAAAAAMASDYDTDTGVKLKIYHGNQEGWSDWSDRFVAKASRRDLAHRIGTTRPQGEDAAEAAAAWDKDSTKLYYMLIEYTAGAASGIVKQHKATTNGVAAWQALKDKYELKGFTREAELHNKWHHETMSATEDPDRFFLRFEKPVTQLRELGVEISDRLLVGQVMCKLPPNYLPLRTLLDNMEDELGYEYLKRKMRCFYVRNIAGDGAAGGGADDQALVAGATVKCFGCGERGHIRAQCPRRSQSYGGRGGGGHGASRGLKGGRGGGRSRGFAWRGGSRGQGNGNKLLCWTCGQDGHKSAQCPSSYSSGGTAHFVEEEAVALVIHEDEYGLVSRSSPPVIILNPDSGASSDMMPSGEYLSDVEPADGYVTVANGVKVKTVGKGTLEAVARCEDGVLRFITISNVLIVPTLTHNLLSVDKVLDRGGNVWFGKDHQGEKVGRIDMDGMRIPLRHGGSLYELAVRPIKRKPKAEEVAYGVAELWHERLGHRNGPDMRRLGDFGVGVPSGLQLEGKCESCELSKHTHASFNRTVDYSRLEPGELFCMDVLGPMEVESIGGHRYAFMLTCARTKWRQLYLLKTRDEVCAKLEQFVLDISGLLGGRRVRALRVDNGGEFISQAFKNLCKSKGIHLTLSGAHAPQQNGVAERSWRTAVEMMRCMRRRAGLAKKFWGELLSTAAYLLNRLPSASLGGDTPYHALLGKHVKMDHLRVIGCRAFAHVYDNERRKLDDKAWKGVLLGYDETNRSCYRIYNPATGKVKKSVHVTFDETSFPARAAEVQYELEDVAQLWEPAVEQRGAQQQRDEPAKEVRRELEEQQPERAEPKETQRSSPGHHDEEKPDGAGDKQAPVGAQQDEKEEPSSVGGSCSVGTAAVWKWTDSVEREADNLGRGRRVKSARHLCNLAQEHAFVAAAALTGAPTSYKEAVQSVDKRQWICAMEEEMKALTETGALELVERPAGANVIDTRWVFKVKCNERGEVDRYKARLVAKGFVQVEGVDYFDVYAPVTKPTSIRVVLAIANLEDWDVDNMDVDTAFLQSPVHEEIYVAQPEGFERQGPKDEELVCRVHKSLYGLKQAPRNWNLEIDGWLREFGLVPSRADPCLYVLIDEGSVLVVLLYVDDLIITGNSRTVMDQFKAAISDRFKMKDLGMLRWILGMEVRRDRARRILHLSQGAYINTVLARFGMENCKPVATPAEGVLRRLDNGHADREFMQFVGSVLYLAMISRPDIAFAVQNLGRHMQRVGPEHWVAAKRLLRYLGGTRDLGLQFNGSAPNVINLVGYSDADWAGDVDTRRSTTAFVFVFAGACISWASRLQPTVALSSAEAEYMALCAGAQEAIHLRTMLRDLGYEQEQPTVIYEDNQACIAMGNNPTINHKRSKHIDIRYHFTRERVESGEIELAYVPTEHQLADLLTKALESQRVAKLRDQVLGYNGM